MPNPDFRFIRQVESSGTLRGNALVTSFQGRIIKPLKVKAQYTLSRTTDDVSGLFDLPANNYDLRAERGRSEFDKLHRFNFASILDLPCAKVCADGMMSKPVISLVCSILILQ